jgi:lysophospholipase L1-like esterase
MVTYTAFSSLLFASLAVASPHKQSKPPAFFLAGDSTTAVQSTGGGGWGNGFLATLKSPAFGVNKGHNGATTVSFVDGGDWKQVLDLVKNATSKYDVYVTIQFGHNDQVSECFFPWATVFSCAKA